MITIKQATEILGTARKTAQRIMDDAGIKKQMKPFRHGKKIYYDTTAERLIELKNNQDKEYLSTKQSESLKALEIVFNNLTRSA